MTAAAILLPTETDRPHVDYVGGVIRLVIPHSPVRRVVVLRELFGAATTAGGFEALLFTLCWLAPPPARDWWLVWAFAGLFIVALPLLSLRRLLTMPAATVLSWDGRRLRAEKVYGPDDPYNDDWPLPAADPRPGDFRGIEVVPLRPLWLTGCGTVRVRSEAFGSRDHRDVGVGRWKELHAAVADFRAAAALDGERN